jgi:hypothetical protein
MEDPNEEKTDSMSMIDMVYASPPCQPFARPSWKVRARRWIRDRFHNFFMGMAYGTGAGIVLKLLGISISINQ